MQSFLQDLRFGIRLLRKDAGFTAVALVTLALTIGANATIFSLVDALFFRPLPLPDADRIVYVDRTRPARTDRFPLSLADYADIRSRATLFTELAAHYPTSPLHVVIDGEPRQSVGTVATASYFTLLGLQPAHGRFFTAAEDTVPGRDAVAVIAHGLWQERFGGSPDAIGRTIQINGTPFSIIGVAPRGFNGVVPGISGSDIWIPAAMFRVGYRFCDAFQRSCAVVRVLGKLRDPSQLAAAHAELEVIGGQLATAYPQTHRDTGIGLTPAVGAPRHSGQDRIVALLLASVAALLLIACANLGGLLLARAIKRRREIAARLAIGATRWRIVRQLFTESLLLAAGGGLLGLAAAMWGRDFVEAIYAVDYSGRPVDLSLHIDGRVVAATLGLSALVAFLFGAAPAWQTRRADVISIVREEGVSGGALRSRLRGFLVAAQVTLSLVLLAGALLLARSVDHLHDGPGFDPSRLIVLRLRPSLVGHSTEAAWRFQKEVVRRLEAMPGVAAASVSEFLPMFGGGPRVDIWPGGERPARREDGLPAFSGRIGARYFQTLGLPLLEGREFDDRDGPGAADVAIVSENLARRLWPQQSAVGRPLVIGGRTHQIVGVVRDLHYYSRAETPQPYVFRSYWQRSPDDEADWGKDSRTHVRVLGDPKAMMPAIRREIAAIDPSVPLAEDYPLIDRINYNFRPLRIAMAALVVFGVIAAFLSAIGVYGVLAFTVSQRTREIAIRVALGAAPQRVARAVLRQSLSMVAFGAAAGVLIALALATRIASLIYGVSPYDTVSIAGSLVVLTVVAAAASYLPARRATRVDPAAALRYE